MISSTILLELKVINDSSKTNRYLTSSRHEDTTRTFPSICCHCLKLIQHKCSCRESGEKKQQQNQPRWRQITPEPKESKYLASEFATSPRKIPTWRKGRTAKPQSECCPDWKANKTPSLSNTEQIMNSSHHMIKRP